MTPTFFTSPDALPADTPNAPPNVVLVGISGAGKSSVGRAVAAELGRAFLDFDDEIERRAEISIAAIFAERGEGRFREMERQLTEDCAQMAGMILAPGGGWIGNVGVIELLRPPAQMIYLKVRPESAARRLAEGGVVRPLLTRGGNPAKSLEKMLAEREPLYAKSDVSVNTEMYDLERLIHRVTDVIKG